MTLWEWQPSVATAALWLLTATALLVVWYQVPVHDWQRAIMLGLAPYLLVFVTLLDLLQRHGWTARAEVGIVDSVAYLALVVFWAWAAWRRDPVAVARRGAVVTLELVALRRSAACSSATPSAATTARSPCSGGSSS